MNRIRFLRTKNSLKQEELAKVLQVSQSSLSGYENGRFEPDSKTLLKLADYFHVSTDFLLGRNFQLQPGGRPPEDLYPRPAPEEECQAPPGAAADGGYFSFAMEDAGMEPRIRPGDLILARRQVWIPDGGVAVVRVGPEKATVRKTVRAQDGLVLIPWNPRFQPVFYSGPRLAELPVTVLGRVIEFHGRC